MREHANTRGDSLAFAFLHGPGDAIQSLTLGQLDRLAGAVAGALRSEPRPGKARLRSTSGDCVLLLFEPGLEFVVAFLGCLIAGRPAVPLRPPRTAADLPALMQVLQRVDAGRILMDTATQSRCIAHGIDAQALERLHCVDWLQDPAVVDSYALHRPDSMPAADAPAFVQFTSGSTGNPKGVVVSHGNILDNQKVIADAFAHDDQTTVVGWLPHYHDMGLIGNILQPIFLGRPCHLMAPATFLQRPMRWLRAIAAHENVTSGGPNFAFQHCLSAIRPSELEPLPQLDLSGWQLAFVGAEPVRAQTMRAFAERFAPFGFAKGALYPCYGLAETTLMLAGGTRGEGATSLSLSRRHLDSGSVEVITADPEQAIDVVACGSARGDNTILIVDPATDHPAGELQVGEIWARGPSVASGYFADPEGTEQRFAARPYGASGSQGTFLRTGDLGFMRGGQLFVTGRLGSLIILNGRNFYPQDIEASIAALHPSFRVGGSAAFAVPNATGADLVVVQEVRRAKGQRVDPALLLRRARAEVSARFGVRLHDLVLTSDSILRTTSGKTRHDANRQHYQNPGFRRVAAAQQRTKHA